MRDGTPVPQPAEAISPENVGQIAELARWGDGRSQTYFPIDDDFALSQTVLGITAYNPASLDIYWRFEPPFGVDTRFDISSSKGLIALGDEDGGHMDTRYRFRGGSISMARLILLAFLLWPFAQSVNLLVSASEDDTIAIWSIPETSLVYQLNQTQSGLIDLEVFDGRILFWDRTETIIWRLEDGDMIFKEDGRTLAVFPEAGLFASNNPLSLRTIEDGEILQSFSKAIGPSNNILAVSSVALSSDHRKFCQSAISSRFDTDVWDVATGDKVYELISPSSTRNSQPGASAMGRDPYMVTALGFSKDGDSLTVVSGHPDVDYWDMQTGQLLRNESDILSGINYRTDLFLRMLRFFTCFLLNSEWLAGNSYLWNVKTYSEKRITEGIELIGFSSMVIASMSTDMIIFKSI